MKAAERRSNHVTYWSQYLNAMMTIPRACEAVSPPDFEYKWNDSVVAIELEWRGLALEFWTVTVSSSGVFRPQVEIDLDQARTIAAALQHFDARNNALLHNETDNNSTDSEN